jgi:hypothetical protein
MRSRVFLKPLIDNVSSQIEARAHDGADPPWVRRVAMVTGVLAAFSGFLAVRSTILTNDAIYMSNQAIMAQTQSSDAWAEYQADSVKARIVETALLTAPSSANQKFLEKEAQDLRSRQPALRKEAIGKAGARDNYLKDSVRHLREKDILSYAEFAAQIGIALASVAALVRARKAFLAGIAAGVMGMAITAYSYWMHYLAAP